MIMSDNGTNMIKAIRLLKDWDVTEDVPSTASTDDDDDDEEGCDATMKSESESEDVEDDIDHGWHEVDENDVLSDVTDVSDWSSRIARRGVIQENTMHGTQNTTNHKESIRPKLQHSLG